MEGNRTRNLHTPPEYSLMWNDMCLSYDFLVYKYVFYYKDIYSICEVQSYAYFVLLSNRKRLSILPTLTRLSTGKPLNFDISQKLFAIRKLKKSYNKFIRGFYY